MRLVESHPALLAFGLCGLVGVLVDVDHLAAIVLWRYVDHSITEGRIFHTPLFIITGSAICCIYARLGGLHFQFVLVSVAVAVVTTLTLVLSSLVVWSW